MEIESAESHAAAYDGGPGRDEDVFLDPEHSGPVAKCLCAMFFVVGMMIAGIYLMLLFVVIEFDESGSAQVFFLIASFFGVLASCSLVMCLMLLLPRYTGTLGIKYLRYKHHEDLLQVRMRA